MPSFTLRPRFKKDVHIASEELEELLKAELKKEGSECVGYVGSGYSVIKIPMTERHFWSPQLSISFEEKDGATQISGLYGPNPTVWAVFFFGYVALGIIGLFILVIGFSRFSLGMGTGILWVLPVLLVAALILYVLAQGGQKIGAQQMFTLHHFFEGLVDEKVKIR